MKFSLRTYAAYSIGCLVVWAVLLAVVESTAGNSKRHTVLLVFLGWWAGRGGSVGQVAGRGRAWRRVNAVVSSWRQGQVSAIRRWMRRAPRVIRAAVCRSR